MKKRTNKIPKYRLMKIPSGTHYATFMAYGKVGFETMLNMMAQGYERELWKKIFVSYSNQGRGVMRFILYLLEEEEVNPGIGEY